MLNLLGYTRQGWPFKQIGDVSLLLSPVYSNKIGAENVKKNQTKVLATQESGHNRYRVTPRERFSSSMDMR